MNVVNLTRTVRHLLRAELLIAEIRLKLGARKAVLAFAAAIAFTLGFIMLNVAAYQWLKLTFGPVNTPLGIAAADFIIAGLAVTFALAGRPGPELDMALNIRKTLTDQLDEEMGSNPFLSRAAPFAAAPLLLPVVNLLINAMRRKQPLKP